MQDELKPDAWMYEDHADRRIIKETRFFCQIPGWTETPLYAHPPTTTPVAVSETPVGDHQMVEGENQRLREALDRIRTTITNVAPVEQASPDVREVLMNAAFETANGNWSMDQVTRFTRFLDAEAYTDAALMLVPENHRWAITSKNSACCTPGGVNEHSWVYADAPALAICEAALRAKGPGHEQ